MNEIRTLMEKFWICRDSDKETFYKVKRDIPNFQRFIREQLGWKLIHTEKEYCEMDEDRLVETILKYMTDWMMVRSEEERITVLPAVGRLAGQYPSDYKGDGEE